MDNLGRLVRTLGEKCKFCGRPLQLRARKGYSMFMGEQILNEVEYIHCSNPDCDFEREVEQKKRKQKMDRGSVVELVPDRRDNGYNQRNRSGKSNGDSGKRSDWGRHK